MFGVLAFRRAWAPLCTPFEVEDDVLAHAPYRGDAAVLERGGDFARRRFQRLALPAQPDGFDHIAGDAPCQSAGDGFYFGEFWHVISLQGRAEKPRTRFAVLCGNERFGTN